MSVYGVPGRRSASLRTWTVDNCLPVPSRSPWLAPLFFYHCRYIIRTRYTYACIAAPRSSGQNVTGTRHLHRHNGQGTDICRYFVQKNIGIAKRPVVRCTSLHAAPCFFSSVHGGPGIVPTRATLPLRRARFLMLQFNPPHRGPFALFPSCTASMPSLLGGYLLLTSSPS
ncbi:hypothetical protein LX36DRAFT_178684 [Colletotrichum falcatum]|nr:hypothetical protein LX36DRAFT_178684 [Colletotrichum falcatum]